MKKNITDNENKITNSDEAKTTTIDNTDRMILNLLQKNNQLTNLELAELVHLSPPPCLRRVRRLREQGIITSDVSIINPFKIKQNLICFLSVSLDRQGEDRLERFEQKILAHPEIKQCYFISGEMDYLLMVHVEHIDAYNEFIRRVFVNIPNLKSFKSSFCLSRLKYDTSITLNEG